MLTNACSRRQVRSRRRCGARYSIFLLYWYESTCTDAALQVKEDRMARLMSELQDKNASIAGQERRVQQLSRKVKSMSQDLSLSHTHTQVTEEDVCCSVYIHRH